MNAIIPVCINKKKQPKKTKGRQSPACYFATVNDAEYSVFSHFSFSTPPPEGFFSIAIVNWSTGDSSAPLFKSIRARSCFSSYCSPHCPICLLTINFEVPDSSGKVKSV